MELKSLHPQHFRKMLQATFESMRGNSTGISVAFSTELENRSQIKMRFINGLEVLIVDTVLLFLV